MKKLWFMTCLPLLVFNLAVLAQQPKSFSQRSYERARQVLDEGVQAIGDVQRLESLGDIKLQYTAKAVEIGQSANPAAPYYVTQAEGTRVLDFRGQRSYQELSTHFLGAVPLRLKEVVTENSGFTIELSANAVYPIAANSVAGSIRAAQNFCPQYLLASALTRAGSLRWLGVENYKGRPQQVIAFSPGDAPLTLYFDARTHLLTKYESLIDNLTFGVTTFVTVFTDYRQVGQVKLPYRVTTEFAGGLNTDLRYTSVASNTHPNDSLFELPQGAELGPATGGNLALTVTKLAPDVYYVNNGLSARGNFCLNNIFFYSQLFVVFNDYVMVVEAPRNDGLSQAVIAKIKELAPGKPIKYVALTHYHTDHLGGVRGYIAEGATVLTTPGNKSLIEHIASMPLPFNPDTLSRRPHPLMIETFTDRRVLTDGAHTVELYNIGSPHADEIVFAYLPQERIVFASDIAGIFAFAPKNQVVAANPTSSAFVQRLAKLGLAIDTVASGHGRVFPMQELRQAVGKREASRNH
jgi:glyoxylase-like metal-dependent hydrolase (beta-lactamase superfamily II)